jgi:hypothetical protein
MLQNKKAAPISGGPKSFVCVRRGGEKVTEWLECNLPRGSSMDECESLGLPAGPSRRKDTALSHWGLSILELPEGAERPYLTNRDLASKGTSDNRQLATVAEATKPACLRRAGRLQIFTVTPLIVNSFVFLKAVNWRVTVSRLTPIISPISR